MTEETNLFCNLCWHLDGRKVPVPYGVVINQRAFDLCEKHFQEPLQRFELDYLDFGEIPVYSPSSKSGSGKTRTDPTAMKKRYGASHSRHVAWKAANVGSLPSRPPLVPGFYDNPYEDESE